MKIRKNTVGFAAAAVTMSLVLAGCGGEKGPVTSADMISGIVIDGPLQKSEVFWDCNGNQTPDVGEGTILTDSSGKFNVAKNANASCRITAFVKAGQSVDLDSPQMPVPFSYTMYSPRGKESVISPATTLLSDFMEANSISDAAAANSSLNKILSTNFDFTSNYIANNDDPLHNLSKSIVPSLEHKQAKCVNVSSQYGTGFDMSKCSMWRPTPTFDFGTYSTPYQPGDKYKVSKFITLGDQQADTLLNDVITDINTRQLISSEGNIIWDRVNQDKLSKFVDYYMQGNFKYPKVDNGFSLETIYAYEQEMLKRINQHIFDVDNSSGLQDIITGLRYNFIDFAVLYAKTWTLEGKAAGDGIAALVGIPVNEIFSADQDVQTTINFLLTAVDLETDFGKCIKSIGSITNQKEFSLNSDCTSALITLSNKVAESSKDGKIKTLDAVLTYVGKSKNLAIDSNSTTSKAKVAASVLKFTGDILDYANKKKDPNITRAAALVRISSYIMESWENGQDFQDNQQYVVDSRKMSEKTALLTTLRNIRATQNTAIMTHLNSIFTLSERNSVSITTSTPTLSLVADSKTPSPSVTATVSGSTTTGVTWTAYKADGTTPAPEVTFHAVGPANPSFPVNKLSTITVTVSTPGKYVLKATADADATKFATVQVDATAPVNVVTDLNNIQVSGTQACKTYNFSTPLNGKYTFTASGTLQFYSGGSVDPTGSPNFIKVENATFPDHYVGFFVIKDGSRIIPVGKTADVDLNNVSQLDMCINDNLYSDNVGGYTVSVQPKASVTTGGLVAHYTFDDCANLGKDTGGNSLNGTVTGGVSCVTANGRNVAQFDGSTGFIKVASDPRLALKGIYTLSATVKFNNLGPAQYGYDWEALLAKSNYSGNYALMVSHSGSTWIPADQQNQNLLVSYHNGTGLADITARLPIGQLKSNEWHTITATSDGAVGRMYLDGVLVSTQNVSVRDTGSSDPLFIGMNNVTSSGYRPYYFGGQMSDVRIYSRALSDSEIAALPKMANPFTSLFVDDFNGSSLDTTKWAVSPAQGGGGTLPISPYSVTNGSFIADVVGGGDGYMGLANGLYLKPQYNPTGDFTITMSARELARSAMGGYTDNSGIGLVLGNASIGIAGPGSSYFTGYSYGQLKGHRIQSWCSGSAAVDKMLNDGTLYTADFRIRRAAGKTYVGYKLAGDADWTEKFCTNDTSTSNFMVQITSSDGGNTRQNGNFKGAIDRFEITKP